MLYKAKTKAQEEMLVAYHHEYYLRHKKEIYDRAIEWQRLHPDKLLNTIKLYRHRHPEIYLAHYKANYAIQSGRITKQPCEVCGGIKSEAHHDDYSKPYDVRWLCRKHHREYHKNINTNYD